MRWWSVPRLNFYPSLMKHNSSNYYVNNLSKKRLGNLNATFMMRTPEVFLIAAEADIYVNGGANAMQYINQVRERAGAKALSGAATVEQYWMNVPENCVGSMYGSMI